MLTADELEFLGLVQELTPELRAMTRDQWPTFIVRTQTVYEIAAPTAERVLQYFADWSDIELDCVVIDYGTIEVLGQVALGADGQGEVAVPAEITDNREHRKIAQP
jgi:hypothetical protein